MASHRDPAPVDEPAPQRLNKYRLLARLARGGMAEVFLARADGIPGLDRLLVIKRILPELASETEFVRMFLDEARIATTLVHPNIVRVFEVDIAEGQVFYVMEHLHGHDLGALLGRLAERGARLPLDTAIALGASVASGLHHAHDRRSPDGEPLHIVHRDVAPGNVLITFDGEVKLIDFGIAKAAGNLNRTRFGLFKGKLPYASPEQCRCEPIDRRSDVFSLGVLLYELTVGARPFTADSEHELLRAVSDAVVVPPRARDRGYPAELEAIVLKALAPDPARRHATARELQRELTAFAGERGLELSAAPLAQLMASAFDPELTEWHTAERRGTTLEEHITSITQQRTLDWQRPAAGSPAPEAPPPPRSAVAGDAAPAEHVIAADRRADAGPAGNASQSPAAVRRADVGPAAHALRSPAAVRRADVGPAAHAPRSPAVRRADVGPAAHAPRSPAVRGRDARRLARASPARLRSPVLTIAFIAVAAIALVAAGALGALWLTR